MVIIILTASVRIYMLFVSLKELVLGVRFVLALQPVRAGIGQSFAAPPQLSPFLSLLAVRYLLLTVTLLETDIRLDRNGYNGSWPSKPSKRPR